MHPMQKVTHPTYREQRMKQSGAVNLQSASLTEISSGNKPLALFTVMCQVWQVLLRDLEEALTHLLMHEVLYPSRLPSSSTVLGCTNLTASNGLCPWSKGLQDPCPKCLFCSQTTPWNKLLAVVVGFPPALTWVTYNALSPQPVWAEPLSVRALKPPLTWSSKSSYTLRADSGFSAIWVHKEHNQLLFSHTSLCSKAKGIQTDQSCSTTTCVSLNSPSPSISLLKTAAQSSNSEI